MPKDKLDPLKMAEKMEEAFGQEWLLSLGDEHRSYFPDPYLKIIFRAISKGVIRHMEEYEEAFKVRHSYYEDYDYDEDSDLPDWFQAYYWNVDIKTTED